MAGRLRMRAWAGRLETMLLVVLMVSLTLIAAWRVFGPWSILPAAALGLLSLISLGRSSLPRRLRNARLLSVGEAPELYGIVRELSRRAGLGRTPLLCVLVSPEPNAAAVGARDDAAILVTPSLMRGLDERELVGVLAHEVSHIRNNDLRLFGFTETVRRIAVSVSQVGWFLLFLSLPVALFSPRALPSGALLFLLAAPASSHLLQLAILRSRELAADLGAVELTGDPRGLASALRRIEATNRSVLEALLPFPVREEPALTRTHPATAERVRRLEAIELDSSWRGDPTWRASA